MTSPAEPTMHPESKYTQDRIDRVIRSLRAGNYRETAARYGGINTKTFYNWLEAHPEFAEAVTEAEAESEVDKVARIAKAGEKLWTANAWLLERMFPERWGRVDRVEIYKVQKQAEALEQELKAEGVSISSAEILKRREALSKAKTQPAPPTNKHLALPAPEKKSKPRKRTAPASLPEPEITW